MGKAIFLTGVPGCGKTTAIRKIVSSLRQEVHGFITEEVREGGIRQGFKIITLDGHEGILAHMKFHGTPHIGKYGVDLDVLNELGVSSLRRALETRSLAIVDEIGPMEILSEGFRQVLMDCLDSDIPVLGTIVKRSLSFTDKIKARANVEILEIQRNSQDRVVTSVIKLIQNELG